MNLIHKIESLRYDIENGVVTDVISISVRLIQIKDRALQLQQTGVVRSCSHNFTTNYCNSDGSYSHKMCDDCGDVIWD